MLIRNIRKSQERKRLCTQAELLSRYIFLNLMVQMTNMCLEMSFDKLAEFTSLFIHWFKEKKLNSAKPNLDNVLKKNNLCIH